MLGDLASQKRCFEANPRDVIQAEREAATRVCSQGDPVHYARRSTVVCGSEGEGVLTHP
jgi:hypothetical protein